MLAAADSIDPGKLPSGFSDARAVLREALARIEASALPEETVAVLLLTEMMPRLACAFGPAGATAILSKMADSVRHEATACAATRQSSH
jgi:hypothetical protein